MSCISQREGLEQQLTWENQPSIPFGEFLCDVLCACSLSNRPLFSNCLLLTCYRILAAPYLILQILIRLSPEISLSLFSLFYTSKRRNKVTTQKPTSCSSVPQRCQPFSKQKCVLRITNVIPHTHTEGQRVDKPPQAVKLLWVSVNAEKWASQNAKQAPVGISQVPSSLRKPATKPTRK